MFTGQLPPTLLQAAFKVLRAIDQPEPLFKKGELVEGKILKVISANKALVRLGGVEMLALTESKMMEGQNIVGRVAKVSPNITVEMLAGGAAKDVKNAAMMRLLMPGKAPMGKVFANIIEMAEKGELPPKSQTAVDSLAKKLGQLANIDPEKVSPEQIKNTIKRSGLYLEAALKETAMGKTSPKALRVALQSDVKALVAKTLAVVEGEVEGLMKKLEAQGILEPSSRSSKTMVNKNLLNSGAPKPTGEPSLTEPRHEMAPDRAGIPSPLKSGKQVGVQSRDPSMNDLLRTAESAKQLRDVLHNIELNQLLNSSSREREGSTQNQLLFQLPFLAGMNAQTARVYIRPKPDDAQENKKKEAGSNSIVFMLNMSKLGPVRVDVAVAKGSVTGSVYTLNDTVARFVKDSLPLLLKPLKDAGYDARFEVGTAEERFVTEELEILAPITSLGMVDVKA